MKILSLKLIGFKRMMLNNVKSFTIEPTEPIQLILGTNGSGKSSLLQELTPLPASMGDYTGEGSKTISIEHHGSLYSLKSTFSNGQKHSFKISDEELNPGGTLSVQKELVKQHFNITNEIHTLLTGQIGLSTMSPSDRRYWFTKLSDTNYDYAISVYNKLREGARDISGALKTARSRLVTETAKVITVDEKDNLQIQVDELHDLLQRLLEYRQPISKTPQELSSLALELEKKITSLFLSLMKKKRAHESNGFSIDSTVSRLQELEAARQVEKLLIERFFTEHTELEATIAMLYETGGANSQELQKQLEKVLQEIQLKKRSKKLCLDFDDIKFAKSAFETVYDILTSVFVSLPYNPDRKYSSASLAQNSEATIRLKSRLTTLLSELSRLDLQKQNQEHQKSHDVLECPKCSHKWARGFDQTYYDAVLVNIDNRQEEIDEVTTQLQESQSLEEEITSYATTFKEFSSCVKNWPILKPLWNKILDGDLIANNPRAVLGLLETFKYDLTIDTEIDTLNNEHVRLKGLLTMAEKLGEADINKLSLKLEDLDSEMAQGNAKIQECNIETKYLTLYKRDMEDIISLSSDIELLVSSFTLCYHDSVESFRRGALIDAIRSVQIVLAKKEQLLSEMKIQASIIEDIQKQISTYEVDEATYKELLRSLSPVDGLIAQGLLGFISTFVRQMNSFIKKIWMYPLQIVPCGLNSDGTIDLDYKFPLNVQNELNKVPDVSKGSTAMKEIVDLAFKLTAMKYLGLQESPLQMDEFGASFDAAHRIAGVEAIKALMDQQPFTQLFMVSHYEGSYGALTNAQVCVICPSNIVIPKGAVINNHVRIE